MAGYNFSPTPALPGNTNIFWIPNQEAVNTYPIAPGGAVALWDSNEQCIYIKTADASGFIQPIRILDYTERKITSNVDNSQFITESRLNDILDEKFAELKGLIQTNQRPFKKGGNNNGKPAVQPS